MNKPSRRVAVCGTTLHIPMIVFPVIALVAVLVHLAGCAAAPAPGPDAAAPSERVLAQAEAALTNDATALRQRWRLFNAQQVLDQRCMRKLDFRYLITSAGPEPSAGVTTPDVLGSGSPPDYGVVSGPSGTIQSGAPAQDKYVRSLPAAVRTRYLTALAGPDDQLAALTLPSGASGAYATGGCVAQTRARLYGSVRAALEDTLVPQDVNKLFSAHLATDRPYRAALGQWQRCMAREGLKAEAPAALIQSLRAKAAEGVRPALLEREQREAATADRRCDAVSELRATLADRREVFLRQQPATTLTRLAEVWRARQQAVRSQGDS